MVPINFNFRDLPEQAREQVSLLDEAQKNLDLIVIGILLRYIVIKLQRKQIICSALFPESSAATQTDTFPLEVVSSGIIVFALFQFQRQSGNIACQAAAAGNHSCRQQSQLLLDTLVLLIALIRLGLLLTSRNQPNAQLDLEEDVVI